MVKYIQWAYNINGFSLEEIEASFDEINNAASKIYDPNNFILLVMGNQDSCATFLEQFDDVEYYEQAEELRASASSPWKWCTPFSCIGEYLPLL